MKATSNAVTIERASPHQIALAMLRKFDVTTNDNQLEIGRRILCSTTPTQAESPATRVKHVEHIAKDSIRAAQF
jgi:hypothetical protein